MHHTPVQYMRYCQDTSIFCTSSSLCCIFVHVWFVLRYNLLLNNCEHFARWCKTGHKRSLQTESFVRCVKRRAVDGTTTAVTSSVKWFLSSGYKLSISVAKKLFSSPGETFTKQAVANQVIKSEAGSALSLAGKLVAPTLIVANEVRRVCRDIKEARGQRARGEITREEFIRLPSSVSPKAAVMLAEWQ